ncbi:PREDICTED: small VCP/p97-interacting protein, partial [Chaetura pelagica]|uniref:small VCP/p97-interacting protein n=1 Tax=Chaetura pelagica TaxID=8897 RepID=UPI00052391BA
MLLTQPREVTLLLRGQQTELPAFATPQLRTWGENKEPIKPGTEVKRRQLAEAAEKRQMEASSRGIKNVQSVEQKRKKQEEIEKRIAASGSGGGGGGL